MKTKTLAALTMILGIALSTSAYAQGRHDERPHGSTKPTAEATGKERNPNPGGRHDEKPHGPQKAATKMDSGKSAADGDDKCCSK